MNQEDVSNAHQELLALWVWLQSFPQVEKAVQSGELQDNVDVSAYIKRCFDNVGIASAILSAAQEISGTQSGEINYETANDDVSVREMWKQIFHLETSYDPCTRRSRMLDTDADWRCPALRMMLCRAVSKECERREEYIARILALNAGQNDNGDTTIGLLNMEFFVDFDVQQILMKIVRGRDAEPNDVSETVADEDCDQDNTLESAGYVMDELNEDTDVTTQRSSQQLVEVRLGNADHCAGGWQRPDDAIVRLEREMQITKEENERLKQELLQVKQRENDLVFEIENSKANYRAQTLTDEAAYLERERKMKEQYDADNSRLKSQLELAITKCEEGERAKAEVARLNDELDVLRHVEKELQNSKDQLRKCKDRLQELSDVKAQLSQKEDAHGKAVDRNILLENELNQLQPLKRQLETYRVRATNAEVKLAECQHELEKLQHHSEHLVLENTELTETSKLRLNETEQLRQKLVDNAFPDDSYMSGLGEGISELNPALKEEILRLRNENDRLNAFAFKRTHDAVAQLEDKLEDAERLAESFKRQYLHTLSQLETTQQELRQTLRFVESLETDVSEWSKRAGDSEAELAAERLRSLEAQQAAEAKLERETRALLERAALELAAKDSFWSDTLHNERTVAESALAAVNQKLVETVEHSNGEMCQLREETRALVEAEKESSAMKLQQMRMDYTVTIEELKHQAAKERDELIATGRSMMASKKEKVAQEMKKLKEEHEAEISSMTSVFAEFCDKQVAFEDRAKQKVLAYKAKLNVANRKISLLESEVENLQNEQRRIEREKELAKEENERLRRQIGSRMGVQGDMEKSFESLQREYNAMLEENRALMRKTSMASGLSVVGSTVTGGGNMQYDAPTTGSAMSQLRAEYEDTIQSLNDEKRELVMKNSAAISDVQKAEQIAWKLEEEVCRLKEELTSAQLTIQRMHKYSDNSSSLIASPSMHQIFSNSFISSPGQNLTPEQSSRPVFRRMDNDVAASTDFAPGEKITEIASGTSKENSGVKNSRVSTPAKPTPSLFEYMQTRAHGSGENEGPECRQS